MIENAALRRKLEEIMSNKALLANLKSLNGREQEPSNTGDRLADDHEAQEPSNTGDRLADDHEARLAEETGAATTDMDEDDEAKPANGSHEVPPFEKHSKGIGSKLLRRWGHKPGKGLGKNQHGATEPVQPHLRPWRSALGYESTIDFGARDTINVHGCRWKVLALDETLPPVSSPTYSPTYSPSSPQYSPTSPGITISSGSGSLPGSPSSPMMSPSPEPWYTEKSVEGTDVIARLNDLRWEVERLKDEKEGLERTLLNLRWGKDAALDENASLRAENETLQDENASLRAENETLRAKLITSYQDKDDKQDERETLLEASYRLFARALALFFLNSVSPSIMKPRKWQSIKKTLHFPLQEDGGKIVWSVPQTCRSTTITNIDYQANECKKFVVKKYPHVFAIPNKRAGRKSVMALDKEALKVLAGDESTPSRKRRRLELVANDAYDTYCKAFKEYEEAKENEITSGIEKM